MSTPYNRILWCPSCGVEEGLIHKDDCSIYNLPGDKRAIRFAPSAAVKDAIPYTPGERQAKAVIPQPAADPFKDVVTYLALELVKERSKVHTRERYDALWAVLDAITHLKAVEKLT